MSKIVEGQITPFIGPEVYAKSIEKTPELTDKREKYPLASAFKDSYTYINYPLASAFGAYYNVAKQHGYPLEYSYHLARVAQFLAIQNENELSPKEILSSELKKIKPPNFRLEENRNTPYAVLADLNLPLYITSNYDYFMEEALRSRGKEPVSEFCRWNEILYKTALEAGIPSVFDKDNSNKSDVELEYRPTTESYKPTKHEPLVYHLHGIIDLPMSMVLTEKDYFDFVISLNKDESTPSEKRLLPSQIRQTLTVKSLLFVGYRLEDITFRVIFQGVLSSFGARPRQMNAVQIPSTLSRR